MADHPSHHIDTYIVVSDTEPGPLYLAGTLGEFSAITASIDAVSPGNGHFVGGKDDKGEYTEGYCWPSSAYGYCFAREITWTRRGYGNTPNAS